MTHRNSVNSRKVSTLREETRLVVLNTAGLATLIAFTGLVYVRTNEPLILLVGGLTAVVSVVATTMLKR